MARLLPARPPDARRTPPVPPPTPARELGLAWQRRASGLRRSDCLPALAATRLSAVSRSSAAVVPTPGELRARSAAPRRTGQSCLASAGPTASGPRETSTRGNEPVLAG